MPSDPPDKGRGPGAPPPEPTKAFDPVVEYLRLRGCPSHVVRGGLKGLVMAWEKVVQELVFDGYRYGLRDYANDLDRRDLLEGAVLHLGEPLAPAWRTRIAAADQRFTAATAPASRCLVDEGDAARAITREAKWWYYRLPRRHRAPFARDLEAADIQAAPEPPAT